MGDLNELEICPHFSIRSNGEMGTSHKAKKAEFEAFLGRGML